MSAVYIATALKNAPAAREWAATLRECGMHVTSKWHDLVADDAVDPTDDEARQAVLTENLKGIYTCDAVLALMNLGQPRATNCEIGFALALCKRVIWMSGPTNLNTNIFSSHPLVYLTRNGSDALALLTQMARLGR